MTFRDWLVTKLGGFVKEDVDKARQRGRYEGATLARYEAAKEQARLRADLAKLKRSNR